MLSKRDRQELLEQIARTDSEEERERLRRELRRQSIFDREASLDGTHIPDLSDKELVTRYLDAIEAREPYERSRLVRELEDRNYDWYALANGWESWKLKLENGELDLEMFQGLK